MEVITMKKRIITFAIVLASVLVMSSCGHKTTTEEQPQNNTSETNITETTVETPAEETKNKFDVFENELNKNNIVYEKITMSAEMIGAAEGFAYKIGDNKVELYRFDTDSPAYENAVTTGKVVLESFNLEINVILNGEYGIINATPEVLEIFNNL